MIVEERFSSLQNIQNAFEKRQNGLPAVVFENAQRALSDFLQNGFPRQSEEEWKYINLEPILKNNFQMAGESISAEAKKLVQDNVLEGCLGKIVLINGRFQPSLSKVPSEIICCSLLEAVYKYPELVLDHFRQASYLNAFSQLNSAFFEAGVFISVPAETQLKEPIHLIHLISDGAASEKQNLICHPRILVHLATRANLRLIMETHGVTQDKYLSNFFNEIILKESSKLQLAYIQNEATDSYQFAHTIVQQENNSELNFHNFALGANFSKHLISVDLKDEGCICNLNGLYVLSDSNEAHNQIVLNHYKPNCESSQLYKGILDDEARAEFSGTINVAKKAIKTNAKQLNRNLLISPKAKIDTRPQLQIEADDVKCSHGASIGQLEEEQLFYLLSRGLTKNQAKELLTYGFAEEIIEKVKLPSLRQKLDSLFLSNIHSK